MNTIKILIWYFSISNNLFFFILTSYLGNGILGNVYVPSKYSQNTFTPVCCHVCSDCESPAMRLEPLRDSMLKSNNVSELERTLPIVLYLFSTDAIRTLLLQLEEILWGEIEIIKSLSACPVLSRHLWAQWEEASCCRVSENQYLSSKEYQWAFTLPKYLWKLPGSAIPTIIKRTKHCHCQKKDCHWQKKDRHQFQRKLESRTVRMPDHCYKQSSPSKTRPWCLFLPSTGTSSAGWFGHWCVMSGEIGWREEQELDRRLMATTHCLWNSSQEKMEGQTLVSWSRANTRTWTRQLWKVWETKGVLSWMKEDDDNGFTWRLT